MPLGQTRNTSHLGEILSYLALFHRICRVVICVFAVAMLLPCCCHAVAMETVPTLHCNLKIFMIFYFGIIFRQKMLGFYTCVVSVAMATNCITAWLGAMIGWEFALCQVATSNPCNFAVCWNFPVKFSVHVSWPTHYPNMHRIHPKVRSQKSA